MRCHTTTYLTPAQVQALGLTEVERVGAVLKAPDRSVGSVGSVGARLQALAHEPSQLFPDTDEGPAGRADALPGRPGRSEPRAWHCVRRAAQARRGVEARAGVQRAGALETYYQSGSIEGSRPGVFYVNLRDTNLIAK